MQKLNRKHARISLLLLRIFNETEREIHLKHPRSTIGFDRLIARLTSPDTRSINGRKRGRKRSGRISLMCIPDFRTRRNDHYSVR